MKRAISSLSRLSAGFTLMAMASGCATTYPGAPDSNAEHPCKPLVAFPADRDANAQTAELGCSVNANIKAMLEDTRDLDKGRTLGSANGARESLVIGQYEAGQTKPLQPSAPATPSIVLSGGNGAMQ
jgi:hypothetical protein